MSLNHHLITLDTCLHTHLGEHLKNRLCSVTLLVCQAANASQTACTLAEGSKY